MVHRPFAFKGLARYPRGVSVVRIATPISSLNPHSLIHEFDHNPAAMGAGGDARPMAREGLIKRRSSVKSLADVKDDLVVLKSIWFTKAKGEDHASRLENFYGPQAQQCTVDRTWHPLLCLVPTAHRLADAINQPEQMTSFDPPSFGGVVQCWQLVQLGLPTSRG